MHEPTREVKTSHNAPDLLPTPSGFNTAALVEIIGLASLWHFTDAVRPERARVEVLCGPAILTDELISVAPVLFQPGQKFDLLGEDDPFDDAAIALVVPCRDEIGELVDVAAFELRPPHRVATYCGRGIAVSLNAIFEARHHPHFRVPLVASVIDFLKSECVALLPIDWRETGLLLHQRRVGGLVVPLHDASRIERKLQMPMPLFVRDDVKSAA